MSSPRGKKAEKKSCEKKVKLCQAALSLGWCGLLESLL